MNKEWMPKNPCDNCSDGTVNDFDCRELCCTFADYCHDIQLLKKLLEYLIAHATGGVWTRNELYPMLKELEGKK